MREQKSKTSFMLFLLLLLALCNGCIHGSAVAGDLPPWKFAVVSDTQGENRRAAPSPCINEPVVRAIATDIAGEQPDFVLVAGDLVNGWFGNGGTSYPAQYANWKSAMAPLYKAKIPIFPVRGNHDVGPERVVLPPLPAHLEPPPGALLQLEKAFKDAFAEPQIPRNGPPGEVGLSYTFFHKNAFVAALDLCGSHQHKVHQKWLDRELTAANGFHLFVYGHEPAFRVRHRDSLAFFPESRDAFWDSVGRAGGRVYFCGHDHLFNRAMIADRAGNEIRQIISGTGGGRLVQWPGVYEETERVKEEYSNSGHHGYVLVTVAGRRVTVQWKALIRLDEDAAWQILDTFSYALPQ